MLGLGLRRFCAFVCMSKAHLAYKYLAELCNDGN